MADYRYAFQGQELDGETGMEAFQLRLWDGRIGRWLSPDPYGQHFSPYMGMGNNPIGMIDPDGGYCYDSNGNTIPCGDFKEFNNSTSHMTFLNDVVIQGKGKSNSWSAMDFVHTGLDGIGLIPGLGEIADGTNALLYLAEGDHINAGLSAAAMIPLAGYGAVAIKYGRKAEKLVDIYSATKKGKKYFGQSVNYATRYTKKVAKEIEPVLLAKVPKRLANAVEQQMISIHGTVKYGNGMGANKRLQMSLKNQIENKEVMKEAMDFLDTNVPGWMNK